MAMDVLAAEFPDIFTQYIEIVPEVTVPTVEPTVVPVLSQVSDIDTAGNVTSRTIQDIFLEHDYGQKAIVQEDANKNFSKTDFSNTVFSSEENTDTEENLLTEHETEQQYLVESPTWSQYDELDQIIEDLRHCDEDSNSNILLSLEQEKSSLGCNWTSEYSSCDHGPACPFTSKVLDLVQPMAKPLIQPPALPPALPSVVVLRQTPAGYVKVPVTEDLLRLRDSTGPVRLGDITNQKRSSSYRPPANAVLIKVPGPGSACSQCDTTFSDNKSLVKHTRNQHQVYQCSKCGESTVGYYRMASHAKK